VGTTPTTTEPLTDTEGVAAFLHKPESWVLNNAPRLGIPRYRIGNQFRWRLSEVAAWVERQAVSTGTKP
jgi:predicted DNA-binding transcriptional regulator AlpA